MCNCTAADKIKSLDWAGDGFSAKGPERGSEPPPVWRWLEMTAGISFLSQFAGGFYSWIMWIVHLWQKCYSYVDSFHVCICGQASIFLINFGHSWPIQPLYSCTCWVYITWIYGGCSHCNAGCLLLSQFSCSTSMNVIFLLNDLCFICSYISGEI